MSKTCRKTMPYAWLSLIRIICLRHCYYYHHPKAAYLLLYTQQRRSGLLWIQSCAWRSLRRQPSVAEKQQRKRESADGLWTNGGRIGVGKESSGEVNLEVGQMMNSHPFGPQFGTKQWEAPKKTSLKSQIDLSVVINVCKVRNRSKTSFSSTILQRFELQCSGLLSIFEERIFIELLDR